MIQPDTTRGNTYRGMKALVMGLGLHGGGVESALYLARQGAEVWVTDLRDEAVLEPSLEKLREYGGGSFRYILGRHDPEDFKRADMVIKNPGVPANSPYLQLSRRVETDISLFLAGNPARLTAVTGSKGKSSTASAVHWVLSAARTAGLLPGAAYLGGNITVSPLRFLDGLTEADDVVLELSSWQLGDLRGRGLKPRAAILTAIMADHQDRYGGMEPYVADKRVIYQNQDARDATVVQDDPWGRSFQRETQGRPLVYAEAPLPPGVSGGWLTGPRGPALARLSPPPPEKGAVPGPASWGGETVEVVPGELKTPGYHQKKNALAAALALGDLGLPPAFIRDRLGAFPGIEHRLEFFLEAGGVRFYNDSAATIPEAAAAALEAFDAPLVLVTGGTDKNLDFAILARGILRLREEGRLRALVLLPGTGSAKLQALLDAAGFPCPAPVESAAEAAAAAAAAARPGDAALLSPGCASFGLFLHEFDRGWAWKEAVRRIRGADRNGSC